jgi:hypothetical protein
VSVAAKEEEEIVVLLVVVVVVALAVHLYQWDLRKQNN